MHYCFIFRIFSILFNILMRMEEAESSRAIPRSSLKLFECTYIRFKNKRVKKYFRSGLMIITWPSFLDWTHSQTDTHIVSRILNFEYLFWFFHLRLPVEKTATNIWNSTFPFFELTTWKQLKFRHHNIPFSQWITVDKSGLTWIELSISMQ